MQFGHLWDISFTEKNHSASGIQASPASSSRHLYVLSWQKVAEVDAVMFTDTIKYHCSSWHINPHCKCLCGKENLDSREKKKTHHSICKENIGHTLSSDYSQALFTYWTHCELATWQLIYWFSINHIFFLWQQCFDNTQNKNKCIVICFVCFFTCSQITISSSSS